MPATKDTLRSLNIKKTELNYRLLLTVFHRRYNWECYKYYRHHYNITEL